MQLLSLYTKLFRFHTVLEFESIQDVFFCGSKFHRAAARTILKTVRAVLSSISCSSC